MLAAGFWLVGMLDGAEASSLVLAVPLSGVVYMNLASTRRKMWEDILVMELVVVAAAAAAALTLWQLLPLATGEALFCAGGLSVAATLLLLSSPSYESEQGSVVDWHWCVQDVGIPPLRFSYTQKSPVQKKIICE